jgi:hypothetical protein
MKAWSVRLVAALVVIGLLTGCPNEDQKDDDERDAAIYESVIEDLIERSGVELDGGADLPVLFIEAIGPDGILLPVQVEVVGRFEDRYEIRFIDHLDEAVDEEFVELPVPEGSLLIGLGDLRVDGTAEVHSEIYLQVDDVRGFVYTLARVGYLRWEVMGAPDEAEPEGLVASS